MNKQYRLAQEVAYDIVHSEEPYAVYSNNYYYKRVAYWTAKVLKAKKIKKKG